MKDSIHSKSLTITAKKNEATTIRELYNLLPLIVV